MSWKLHNEPWMQKLNVFDEFKIRASWGISGNQGISPYQTLNRYGTEKYWFADNGRRPSARAMKPAAKAPMTAISSGAAFPTPI